MPYICPRCGLPGSPVIRERGERQYYYVVHYLKGERKRYECYLGPTEQYVHVARLHQLKNIAGLTDTDWIKVAEQAIWHYVAYIQHRIRSAQDNKEKEGIRNAALKALAELEADIQRARENIEEEYKIATGKMKKTDWVWD